MHELCKSASSSPLSLSVQPFSRSFSLSCSLYLSLRLYFICLHVRLACTYILATASSAPFNTATVPVTRSSNMKTTAARTPRTSFSLLAEISRDLDASGEGERRDATDVGGAWKRQRRFWEELLFRRGEGRRWLKEGEEKEGRGEGMLKITLPGRER